MEHSLQCSFLGQYLLLSRPGWHLGLLVQQTAPAWRFSKKERSPSMPVTPPSGSFVGTHSCSGNLDIDNCIDPEPESPLLWLVHPDYLCPGRKAFGNSSWQGLLEGKGSRGRLAHPVNS